MAGERSVVQVNHHVATSQSLSRIDDELRSERDRRKRAALLVQRWLLRLVAR